MKNVRTGIYLFVMLLICCASFAAGSDKVVQEHRLFDLSSFVVEEAPTIDLTDPGSNGYNRITDYKDKGFTFQSRFKKKHKTKFLIQHLNFSHYIKKPDRQCLLQAFHLIGELHEASPANNWLIRPAYYTFLFRLCPF